MGLYKASTQPPKLFITQNTETKVAVFMRAKRVSDSLGDRVKANILGQNISYVSSGSEHSGDGHHDNDTNDDSPSLADLVQRFLEDGDETESRRDESESEKVDLSTECFEEAAAAIARFKASSCRDFYRNLLSFHVSKAIEKFSSSRLSDRDGFRRKVMSFLRDLGHNAAICKTKWLKEGNLKPGNFEFIDVTVQYPSATGPVPVRYFVDLEFSSGFEIARPTSGYAKVVQSLPHVFIGMGEDLKIIIETVTAAARKSLKSEGLFLAPWRTKRFMEAKFFRSYRRTTALIPSKFNVDAVKERIVGFADPCH